MVRVMAFGTFDRLHAGHRYFLRQASQHGDELVVVVARDGTVLAVKGHGPHQSEQERLAAVQQMPDVQHAVLGNPGDKYEIVRQFQPHVICLGYDQRAFTAGLPREFPGIRIVRIDAFKPETYKSSKLNHAR